MFPLPDDEITFEDIERYLKDGSYPQFEAWLQDHICPNCLEYTYDPHMGRCDTCNFKD